MALMKWNTNFRLEHFDRENRNTFSEVPLLPKIFPYNDLLSRVPIIYGNFFKW